MLIPIYLPRFESAALPSVTLLAADVGGSKTNVGFFHIKGQQLSLVKQQTYRSQDYPSFPKLMHTFLLTSQLPQPARVSLGVAGPVLKGKAYLTNLGWLMDQKTLEEETGIRTLSLINDLEATAYGLAALEDKQVLRIHEGNAHRGGNIAVMAPGTGLGEAGLYWDGKQYHPFASEGGHTHFSPNSSEDLDLYRFIRQGHETVSWEHLIGGPGIYRIYRFLLAQGKMKASTNIKEALSREDPAAVISQAALDQSDFLCQKTMEIYVRLLACEAANLVLKMKATGGLFLGGGIPPKIISLLQSELFYQSFTKSHRMEDLLSQVPVNIILQPDTALWGAAYYGAYGPLLK